MKNCFVLFLAVAFFCSCGNYQSGDYKPKDGYKVHVKVTGDLSKLKSDTLVLSNGPGVQEVISDTAVIVNGEAFFEGPTIKTPQYVSIIYRAEGKDNFKRLAHFFLENERFEVTSDMPEVFKSLIDAPEMTVKGGTFMRVTDSLKAIYRNFWNENKLDSLADMLSNGKGTEQDRVVFDKLVDSADVMIENLSDEYVRKNPKSLFALYELNRKIYSLPVKEVKARLAVFKSMPEYRENLTIKRIEDELERYETNKLEL